MAFLSVDFFLLLPFAVLLYHLIPFSWLGWRRGYLLVTSYVFYATWSVPHAALLLVTSYGIYLLGRRVETAPSDASKRAALAGGVLLLTLALATFKYAPALGGRWAGLLAPLGISYYTFKLISYLVDVYWEKLPAERDPVAFLLYPVFFPQILTGPIQRARDFLPQLRSPQPVPAALVVSGLQLILFGLFKKFVVADRLALLVNRVFEAPQSFASPALWLGCYAFAIQLYADFSGITDFAIGVGRLFGVQSPPNFNAPFYAPNVQEFWRRWHMTLSSWLTDYVFTPLRLAMRDWNNLGLVLAITINMVAIGVWHGPRWTFVIFGLVNALYMVISALTLKARNRFFKTRPALASWRKVVGPLVTFHLLVGALVFVRARTLPEAVHILTHLLPTDLLAAARAGQGAALLKGAVRGLGLIFDQTFWVLLGIPIMEAIHILQRRGTLQRVGPALPAWVRWSGYYVLILLILLIGVLEVREFIYAQF
jgi:alginate O-acetyltransferase complex protein AlgI